MFVSFAPARRMGFVDPGRVKLTLPHDGTAKGLCLISSSNRRNLLGLFRRHPLSAGTEQHRRFPLSDRLMGFCDGLLALIRLSVCQARCSAKHDARPFLGFNVYLNCSSHNEHPLDTSRPYVGLIRAVATLPSRALGTATPRTPFPLFFVA